MTPSKQSVEDRGTQLAKTKMEYATDVYAIYVETTTKDAYKVRQAFSVPLVLKMTLGAYDSIAAVQEVYDVNGNVTYYDCIVVEYTDGTMSVEVPQTAGTVYIFLDSGKRENKLYWLFSLTAIPLLVGAGFFIYAHVKIKKIKQNAPKEGEEQREDTQKSVTNKKITVRKGKKGATNNGKEHKE